MQIEACKMKIIINNSEGERITILDFLEEYLKS